MKKLILLLGVFTLALTSCTDDDDVINIEEDEIVGTWKFHMDLVNGVEQPLLPCETEDSLQFNLDGTVLETFYDEDANGNCVEDETNNGTWVNNENGFYGLTFDGITDGYILSGNKLTYLLSFDNGTPDDTSDDFTEAEVYIKQ